MDKSFQSLAQDVYPKLKKHGVTLNFKGFLEIRKRYEHMQEYDLLELYDLTRSCSLWADYMGEVQHIVEYVKDNCEIEQKRLESFVSKNNPENNLDYDIAILKAEIKLYKLFIKKCEAMKKFFTIASWNCYRKYGKILEKYLYRELS